MELYFSPLACSMASRIGIYEAQAAATFVQVDTVARRTADGRDYRSLNPLGLVPTLRTDGGLVLTENAAILQYLAEQFPAAELAPAQGYARTRLQQWLSFIGMELHKGLYAPLLDRMAPDGARAYALDKGRERLDVLAAHLGNRETLLDHFSIADAYLVTVLGWSVVTPIDLKAWPSLEEYLKRMRRRASVSRALSEEQALYVAEREAKKT